MTITFVTLTIHRLIILTSMLLGTWGLSAQQDFGWWNEKHNWDGVTNWRDYIITSPGLMGPNALPVPPVKDGRLPMGWFAEVAVAHHFREGDPTLNLWGDVYLPLGEKAGLRAWMVPLERYRMDTLIRDARRARDFDGRGWATGDLNIGTYVQLLENSTQGLDLLLTINLRTASGNELGAARFTDAPGYFFDLSAGKSFNWGKDATLRPHATLGFYVWQTNEEEYRQNDAILYALGIQWERSDWRLELSLSGYSGYIGLNDRPAVVELNWMGSGEKQSGWSIGIRRGINDFPYTSFRLGYVLAGSPNQ